MKKNILLRSHLDSHAFVDRDAKRTKLDNEASKNDENNKSKSPNGLTASPNSDQVEALWQHVFKRDLENEKKLIALTKELNATREEFKGYRRLHDINKNSRNSFVLDLGGSKFNTTRKILSKSKFFAARLKNQEESLSIDHKPTSKNFKIILDHLEGYGVVNRIKLLDSEEKKALAADVEFFGIEKMYKHFTSLSTMSIAVGGLDTMTIYNTHGKIVNHVQCFASNITSIASLSNSKIVSASVNGTISIWNHTNGFMQCWVVPYVCRVVIAYNYGIIIIGSEDGYIRFFHVSTGQAITTLAKHSGIVWILLLMDQDTLVSGSQDALIHVWKIEEGNSTKLEGHKAAVLSLVKLSNTKIVSGSQDHSIRVWNIQTGETLNFLNNVGTHTPVTALTTLSENVIVFGSDGSIMLWEVSEGRVACIGDHVGLHKLVNIGNAIASLSIKDMKIWDVEERQVIRTINSDCNNEGVRRPLFVSSVAV
jgi:WD40 repeat protein